jgi:zinc protease
MMQKATAPFNIRRYGLFFLLPALVFSTHVFSQPQLLEKVERNNNPFQISYEKYRLPNGLTIVLHEDHSDPVVHVDVTYHVGSSREEEGRSGFAHFFEHMMFQGSDHVGDEEHFKMVSAAGGTLNGTTNTDRTNYFETLPSNQLETALWLEADRMGFLLDAVTQKKFEVQRATVKNERGQNYDNRPYGLVNERVNQALYPKGHPYSWPTIGYLEDLDRVDVNDLKRFFLRWYGPNNATITVAGDIEVKKTLQLIEKYFGSIPQGPEVKPMQVIPVQLSEDRFISMDDNITVPMLRVVFPGVPRYHEDEAALDALADILGGPGNKKSPFYERFLKNQKCLQAYVTHPTQELAGTFSITLMPNPSQNLEEIAAEVKKIIAEYGKSVSSLDDIKRFQANHEASVLNSLSGVSGKASLLAANETFTGNPGVLVSEMEKYQALTPEKVMAAYQKYIAGAKGVWMSVYPKNKVNKAAPDNFSPPAPSVPKEEGQEYKSLKYVKAKDSFDRSKKPEAGPSPVFKAPDVWKQTLPNGLKIAGAFADEVPLVSVQLTISGGHLTDPIEKSGLCFLMGEMLKESTDLRSGEMMADALSRLGANFSISTSSSDMQLVLTAPFAQLDSALRLFSESIFRPKFDADDFDRVKNKQLQTLFSQKSQAVTIANNVFSKVLYGENHILGWPAGGTSETIDRVQIDDIRMHYAKYFAPDVSSVSIVGPLSQKEAINKLSFLSSWSKRDLVIPSPPPAAAITKPVIYHVNKDKAAQSEIRIGYVSLPWDATGKYFKATVMNFALGGTFNSRINLNLREDKGYTYGARTSFNGGQFSGPFMASAGVRATATDSALVEFFKEMKGYAEGGITPEELSYTKNSLTAGDALKYETPAQKAGFVRRIVEYGLDSDYTLKQKKMLEKTEKGEIDLLAKELIPFNNMVIVIVGDKNKYFDRLPALGYEIIDVDTDGRRNVFKK